MNFIINYAHTYSTMLISELNTNFKFLSYLPIYKVRTAFKSILKMLIIIICKLAKSMHIWDITNPIWRSSRRLKGLKFCVERYDWKILPSQGKSWGCGSTFGGQLRSIEAIIGHEMNKSHLFTKKLLNNHQHCPQT